MHLRQKLSIREIGRRTGLSRNTVTKHRAADTVEPKFATPERPNKLAPFAETLAGWLKTNAGKPRKERQTLKKMHADLLTLGFTGSFNRVAAFARDWRSDRQREQQTTGRGTFVPLAFRPGEAFQFDWSEDFAVVGGERRKLQVAHIKLSHSRAFRLRAYPLQPMRCCSMRTGTLSGLQGSLRLRLCCQRDKRGHRQNTAPLRVHGWGQDIVLIGGPGTGKTHVATALGIEAVEHHRRKVRFFSGR